MPLTTGEFLYPTDKSVTDIAGMAYLSKKTALEVRPRMLYLQGRLLRQSYQPLAANRDAVAVSALGSEACNAAGRAPRGAQELRGDLRTNSFLNLFNTGTKVNGDHVFSKLSESEYIQVTESYLQCHNRPNANDPARVKYYLRTRLVQIQHDPVFQTRSPGLPLDLAVFRLICERTRPYFLTRS